METMRQEMEIEHFVAAQFGLRVDIKSIIAPQLPVATSAGALIFLTAKNQLFALILGQGRLTVGDIRKIAKRMNLSIEQLLPPRGDARYFDRVAADKFREVFPGRDIIKGDDLRFYKTLVPYNPALIQVSEVVSGAIKQFDRDSADGWRPSIKFSYRRIKTS